MEYPTISVIVLNYNGLRYMQDCFASLNQLDYPSDRVELVLADNASTDGSVDYVREHFPQVRIMQFDKNYGISITLNRATEQVGSEYVAFLNSDMKVRPHWLTGLVEALDDEPGVVCSSSKILNWDGNLMDFGGTIMRFTGQGRANGYHDPDLTAYDDLRYILAPCSGAMLIERQTFLDVGAFDENFSIYFDDIDLGWRLWILGYKVVYAPGSLCNHVHFGTLSQQPPARITYLYERNALFTIIKNYEQQYLDRVLPAALWLQLKRSYLLAEMAGVDTEKSRFRLKAVDPPPSPGPVYDGQYYLKEAWQTLRSKGVGQLIDKIRAELARRSGQPLPIFGLGAKRTLEHPQFLTSQAHLAAANDVIARLPAIYEQRALIQAKRQRTDRAIFETVRALSFDTHLKDTEFRDAQAHLVQALGLQELFGDLFNSDIPFRYHFEEPT
jgi:GT2 family glycosyltransferase